MVDPASPASRDIRLRGVNRVFGASIAFLTLGGVWSLYSKALERRSGGLVDLFNLDYESSVASWYSSFALLCCAGLLAVIALAKKTEHDPHFREWRLLAVIFVLLSLDESVALHELSISPLRAFFHASGVFYFAWVIPGALFTLLVFLRLLPFLRDLDASTRRRFLLSGAVYLAGVLGMEMISGAYVAVHGEDTFYGSLVILEEALEMVGVLLFLHALFRYLAGHLPSVTLTFKP